MTTMHAILLGLVQGLTEFLPISSSAHLVAAQQLLRVQPPGVLLEVSLHAGTLAAILLVLWQEIVAVARDGLRGALLYARGAGSGAVAAEAPLFGAAAAVLVGSIPVACVGMLAREAISGLFDSTAWAGAFLCCTGLILLASRLVPAAPARRLNAGRGFLVGLAQAVALLPGISRSGITIVTGRLVGLDRRAAGRFSFLLATPALAGAALLELWHAWPLGRGNGQDPLIRTAALSAGVLAAALAGTVSLVVLLRVVERGRLHWFAAYCLPAGAAMLLAGLAS